MTRIAWLPLLFVLIAACGDDDERTECTTVPVIDDDAIGDLAVEPDEGEPIFAQRITPESDGRISIDFGGADLYFRRPARAGTYPLDELEGELCAFYWVDCVRIVGKIEVTITEPHAFDGTLEVEGTSEERERLRIHGTSRIVYRETSRETCSTYDVSPGSGGGCNCGGGFPGPGQL